VTTDGAGVLEVEGVGGGAGLLEGEQPTTTAIKRRRASF
jgi:hypothetical protein